MKTPTNALRPLSVKRAAFMQEYLKDLNASAAAQRAGYKAKNSMIVGHYVMKDPAVAAAITIAKAERAKEAGIDAKYVLRHLKEMIEADILDIMTEDGLYKPVSRWPKIWRQMLNGCDVKSLKAKGKGKKAARVIGRVVKIRFLDRLKTLELIGKHIDVRAFVDAHELSGPDGGPIQVAEVHVHYHPDMKPPSMK